MLSIIQYLCSFLLCKLVEDFVVGFIQQFLNKIIGNIAVGFYGVPMGFVHIVAGNNVLIAVSKKFLQCSCSIIEYLGVIINHSIAYALLYKIRQFVKCDYIITVINLLQMLFTVGIY